MWCYVGTYDKDREPHPVPVPSGDGLPFGEINKRQSDGAVKGQFIAKLHFIAGNRAA